MKKEFESKKILERILHGWNKKKVFDKPISTWCLKPCTKCVLYRFYFLKYSKFSPPSKTQFSHNLFKKRRNIVLYIGFSNWAKKVWAFKEKRKPRLESVIEIFQTIGILKSSIVPYISLREKHCSKVIIFHLFWVSDFVQD